MNPIIEQISELYDCTFENKENHLIILEIGKVEAELSNRIFALTGIEIIDFVISIDNYSIIHIMNRHGSELAESSRNQVAITKVDFLLIPQIILSADNIFLAIKKYPTENEAIWFSKLIDNEYFILMEVRKIVGKKKKLHKKNRLILQTFYKKKAP